MVTDRTRTLSLGIYGVLACLPIAVALTATAAVFLTMPVFTGSILLGSLLLGAVLLGCSLWALETIRQQRADSYTLNRHFARMESAA